MVFTGAEDFFTVLFLHTCCLRKSVIQRLSVCLAGDL